MGGSTRALAWLAAAQAAIGAHAPGARLRARRPARRVATARRRTLPPGCSFHPDTSYTFPLMTIQQSSSVACLETSAALTGAPPVAARLSTADGALPATSTGGGDRPF